MHGKDRDMEADSVLQWLVAVEMRGQDWLTERQEDEKPGGSIWIRVLKEGRGAEGHVWVMSETWKRGEESERVIGGQGEESEWGDRRAGKRE